MNRVELLENITNRMDIWLPLSQEKSKVIVLQPTEKSGKFPIRDKRQMNRFFPGPFVSFGITEEDNGIWMKYNSISDPWIKIQLPKTKITLNETLVDIDIHSRLDMVQYITLDASSIIVSILNLDAIAEQNMYHFIEFPYENSNVSTLVDSPLKIEEDYFRYTHFIQKPFGNTFRNKKLVHTFKSIDGLFYLPQDFKLTIQFELISLLPNTKLGHLLTMVYPDFTLNISLTNDNINQNVGLSYDNTKQAGWISEKFVPINLNEKITIEYLFTLEDNQTRITQRINGMNTSLGQIDFIISQKYIEFILARYGITIHKDVHIHELYLTDLSYNSSPIDTSENGPIDLLNTETTMDNVLYDDLITESPDKSQE